MSYQQPYAPKQGKPQTNPVNSSSPPLAMPVPNQAQYQEPFPQPYYQEQHQQQYQGSPEINQQQYNPTHGHPVDSQQFQQQYNPQQSQPDPFASFNNIPIAAGINTFQTAFNASNQYIQSQSKYIDYLRIYFKVDHQYVLFRLINILFPFKQLIKNVDRKSGTEFDAYIPLMSILTYIMLVGLKTGLVGINDAERKKTFSPDVFGLTASFALLIYIVQILVLSLFLYLNNVGSFIAWMDLIALIGYMFVGGALNTFVDLFNLGSIGFVTRTYVCIAMAFFSVF
eukprot:NODE_427_length_8836_cov_0.452215.p3 type:complete len:283 gc:universal NODE_427_length_8836_cov_0.452215:3241-2393(-)